MFDEAAQERLKDNEKAAEELLEGMKLCYEAKKMKEGADELEKEGKKLIKFAMLATDLEKAVYPGVGMANCLQNVKSSTTSRVIMEKYLVEHGVSAELIKKAREAATTSRTQDFQLRFTAEKP
jgi:hypothetical protein